MPNFWNKTYPISGNYWSDFKDVCPLVEDSYNGEYPQSELGGNGVWDGPYEIDEGNIDYYPIVPEFPSFLILPLFMLSTLLAAIVYRRKFVMQGCPQSVSLILTLFYILRACAVHPLSNCFALNCLFSSEQKFFSPYFRHNQKHSEQLRVVCTAFKSKLP